MGKLRSVKAAQHAEGRTDSWWQEEAGVLGNKHTNYHHALSTYMAQALHTNYLI